MLGFSLFLVDKSVNIHDFSTNYIRTTQIPKIFSHTIIISSRRRSIKTTKKILENYEYTGHNLDTITLRFSLLSCKILAAFIMPTYILVDTISCKIYLLSQTLGNSVRFLICSQKEIFRLQKVSNIH